LVQVGYEVYKHWWSFPESNIDGIPFCEAKPKERLDNEYTRDVKNRKLKNPCEYLRNLYRIEKIA